MLVSATMVLLLDAVWTLAATAMVVVLLLMLLEMVMAMMKSRRRGIEEGEGETFGDVGGGCGSDDGLR